jgi:hypothetical protein
MNVRRLLAIVAVIGGVVTIGVPAVAEDPRVRVIVHVVLAVPHALPGARRPWYCAPGQAHADEPIDAQTLLGYDRTLARYGVVHDRFGFGSWTGGDAAAGVQLEAGDHIEVLMRLDRARAVLPAFVRRVRRELDQREVLAEIIGDGSGRAGEARTRIVVRVPEARANFSTLLRLHGIFGDRGNGGATQIADANDVVVWSGVARPAVARIEAALRAAGFAYATEPETFVTAEAPPCS